MDIDDARIMEAVARTEIIHAPKQNLYTFGTTNIHYYLVTEPVYVELTPSTAETVIREGKVIAEKPRIVTPYYLTSLEGFGANARRYFDHLMRTHGRNAPGLFYAYRNEPREMNIVTNSLTAVVERLKSEIQQKGDPLTALIKGIDELWDVSLIRFIYEITNRSVGQNISQMNERGLLTADERGVPADVRYRIDDLFRQVTRGEREVRELKVELDRWGLFEEYEDRFFRLFNK